MPFQPKVSEIISIDGKEYRFNPHPANTETAYAITGKRATIYQLQDEQGTLYALKVFSLAYRSPQIAAQAKQLAPLQSIPGLEACKRRVLIPVEQAELVITHPELRYAVLMPWLPGRTLEELLSEEDALTPEQGLMAAQKLAETLAELEARRVVHGNLNPSNLLVDLSAPDEVAIHLVDLEGMRFEAVQGVDFDATSDLFAGAMLLAELLSGEVVREDIASQEDVAEIIEDRWGRAICDVYERAVSSPTPADCPPLLEWIDALAEFANLQETKIVEQEQTESSSSNNGLDLTVVLILASIILFIVILVLFNL
jgi:serine/threonine protein kinase